MKKTTLGLPLEYQKRPEYFDAHNINEDTVTKNAFIESLLKKHKVKSILDLTCGTGSQVFFLAERGYDVTGADFSPALLEQARNRALRERVDVNFIDGDMRTLKVGQFDAVITIFNAVGHLTKAGFEKAMKNIRSNLKNSGLYIFDIFNLDAMTDPVVADLAMCVQKEVNGTHIYTIQCSTLDKINGILTSYDHYVLQKNSEKPENFNHKFSLQIYTAKELSEMLAKNGFEVLEQCGLDGSELVANKTMNILSVARKI